MFEAKFDREEKVTNGTKFWVSFIDGQEVISEWCIPQSEKDFEIWVEGRKEALNTAKSLKQKLSVGAVIEKAEEIAEAAAGTEEEERKEWFRKVNLLYRIRIYAIESGVIPADDKQVADLVADLQATRKPEYFNQI